ncbi:MAG: DUF1501 domain-containing protein [Gemmataceae bacterium]
MAAQLICRRSGSSPGECDGRGKVIGKTDKIAGDVIEQPTSPKDILATVYHLLGIDPESTLRDRTGRPVPLVSEGAVISEVLA